MGTLETYESIGDIEVILCAELDRRTVSVRELMHLDVGGVVSLSRPAGENIDLYVGNVLLGNAEILVLDEKLAVRVADICEKPRKAPR